MLDCFHNHYGWETIVLTAQLIKWPMWQMAHSKGDWMGQNLIECDYGAWRVQFKYPAHPVFWMTSVGRSDSLKTSYRRLPPPWLITTWSHMFFRDTLKYVLMTSDSFFLGFWKHLIVSLTQALSKWLSKLPACYYGEVISLHLSTPCPMGNCYPWDMVLTSASTYSTF